MNYAKLEWRNDQPYNLEFDDLYFSAVNGIEETEHVFIQHNQLMERFACLDQQSNFVIAETGFGSGLNFLITVKHWLTLSKPSQCLYFYSVEHRPLTLDDLIRAQKSWPDLQSLALPLQTIYQVASYGFHAFDLFAGRVKLILMIGEVQPMLAQLEASVDAWYLDGFAPKCNPDMWSEAVFLHIQRLSKQESTFSTYTAAGFVRRGLMAVGFDVSKVSGIGQKRHMLAGKLNIQPEFKHRHAQPWYESLSSDTNVKGKKITLIGAGIAGLSCAWSLVKRGYQVEIIEAGKQVGAQASGNPQAMVMPRLSLQDAADAEFYTSAYFYALRCFQQLDADQTCWKQTGGIQLPHSDRIYKQMANYPQTASLAKVIDAQTATELSGLSIQTLAHYFPQAACVYPQKLMQRMLDVMGDSLVITYHTEVESIVRVGEQWQLLGQDNKVITQTPCLVLANAWQVKRFDVLAHIHCQPARGQLNYYNVNRQSAKLKLPVAYESYLMPVYKGQQVSGASFKLADCDSALRKSESMENLSNLNCWFSDLFLENELSGGRASVRAVTSDRVPVVGVVSCFEQLRKDYADLYLGKSPYRYPLASRFPGLYVNTGHGARGFTSAFLSSELVAAMICDEPLPISSRVKYALHSSRFLIRSLKKKR